MGRRVPSELCLGSAKGLDQVVEFRGVLLQFDLSYVHKDVSLQSIYKYDASTFADLIFGDSQAPKAKEWIHESQDILKVLKDNLQTTHNQQKMYADGRKVE